MIRLQFIFLLILAPYVILGQQKTHEFKQSQCDEINNYEKLNERIIKKTFINDSLVIVIGIHHICCANFESNYEIDDSELLLSYSNIGDECFCFCFYELTYKIPIVDQIFTNILINNKPFPETDEKYAVYQKVTDTLDDGAIRHRSFRNDVVTNQVIDMDSFKVIQLYREGKLTYEKKIEVKGGM